MVKNCKQCNKEFKTYPSRIKRGMGKFCSLKCRDISYQDKKLSKEHKRKMSEAHIKQWENGFKGATGNHWKKTEEQKLRGDKNPSWKGGVTPINKQIRNSLEYADWRTAVFKRDNYTCQLCGDKGITLHADHIKPFAYYPELRLVIENGRTLCVPCHRKTPTYSRGARNELLTNVIKQ